MKKVSELIVDIIEREGIELSVHFLHLAISCTSQTEVKKFESYVADMKKRYNPDDREWLAYEAIFMTCGLSSTQVSTIGYRWLIKYYQCVKAIDFFNKVIYG